MWLLYLKICTAVQILGIPTEDCIVVTPASYISKSLCEVAGVSYVRRLTDVKQGKSVTFTCEKE